MKKMKKIFALLIAMIMVLGMSTTIFADVTTPSITIKSNSNTSGQTDKTSYQAWELLKASIAEDPTQSGATQTGGKVSYYVTTEAAKNALSTLFTFAQVGSESKWYATPNDGLTAQNIVDALKNKTDAEMTAAFGNPVEFAQTTPGGTATSGTVDAGYYYIKSSLGSNIAIQTLTAVTIEEKNEYVTDDKTMPEKDQNSEIGQDIEYTLTVNVPASANDTIVLTDTMGKGLTFKSITQDTKINGTVSEVTPADGGATKFTITYSAADIKNLVADGSSKVITVKVVATVNDEALVDTNIPNTLDLKYGNNYEAKPSVVNTKTTKATFDKVDGDDENTKLAGAKFKLLKGTTTVNLVTITEGEVYRVATPQDKADDIITEIVTAGKTVTINGLDFDETYKLEETEAPAGGYNKLTEPVELKKNETTFLHENVKNNKGSVLPATGGIGTTIFYIIGAILVIGAGVVLVTRRRMNAN